MERKTKVFIAILMILANTLSFFTDTYAGQATATASIIIIIPERPTTANQTQLVQDNTDTGDIASEQEVAYAKNESPAE
jgi:hypothetical protein